MSIGNRASDRRKYKKKNLQEQEREQAGTPLQLPAQVIRRMQLGTHTSYETCLVIEGKSESSVVK
jgi:hypothetical protein